MAGTAALLRVSAAAAARSQHNSSVLGLRRAFHTLTSPLERCSSPGRWAAVASAAAAASPALHASGLHSSAAAGSSASASSSWWGWAAGASLLGAAAGAATAGAARADSADDTSAVLAAQIPGGAATHVAGGGIGDVLQAWYHKLESWLGDALDRLGSQSLATKVRKGRGGEG